LDPTEDVEGTSDPDGDGVNEFYLGHTESKVGIRPYIRSIEAEQLWLDCAGWRDGDAVTQESANEVCNLDKLAKRFGPDSMLLNALHTFFGEVMELDETERLLVSLIGGPSTTDLIRRVLGDVWLIWYYFFYPGHEEFLRRCEAFFDEKSDGNYEGDWNAVAVVVPKPLTLPWETPNPTFPPPALVGYGVRLRGLAEDIADTEYMKQGMTIRKWDDVEKNGNHPRVYVSHGYHNNYVTPGEQVPRDPTMLNLEIGKLSCGVGEGLAEFGDTIDDAMSDIKEAFSDVFLTLAKIFTGYSIGARFGNPSAGAIAGLAAGLAEANSSSADHNPSAEEWRKKEIEHAPQRRFYGLVITPADVPHPLISDPDPLKNETATEVVQWVGDDASRLVDRNSQIWWSYQGHWGVQVLKDPRKRRSGIEFPDFRRSMLREVLESLTKG